jgi:uncharacterized membrane protein YtjA (UPF0391 family)
MIFRFLLAFFSYSFSILYFIYPIIFLVGLFLSFKVSRGLTGSQYAMARAVFLIFLVLTIINIGFFLTAFFYPFFYPNAY